jgi:hypothetical protein
MRTGVLILMSLTAHAQPSVELCGRIGSQQDLNECTAIVAGRRVDATAVELCGRIGSNRDIVECARAVAGRWVSSEAVSLCSRIGSNRDIVGCARALAGRWLDSGAVQGCNRVGSNDGIVRCARAIADKEYAGEELALCERNGSNDGIVQCMQSTGRRRVSASDADSWFTLANRSAATPLARVYLRPSGSDAPWGMNRLGRSLYPGQTTTLRAPAGTWDVCAEAPDGSSVFWNGLELGDGGGALSLDRGREFPDDWAVRRPCRSF